MELFGIIPEGVGLVLSMAPDFPAWVRVLFLALPFARRAKDLPPDDRAAALAWIESTAADPRRVPGSEPVFVRLPLSWVAAWQGISKQAAKKHVDKLTRAGALVVVSPSTPNRATLYAVAPFASKPLYEVNPAGKLNEVNPLLSVVLQRITEKDGTSKPFEDSESTFSTLRVNPAESKNASPEEYRRVTESKGVCGQGTHTHTPARPAFDE